MSSNSRRKYSGTPLLRASSSVGVRVMSKCASRTKALSSIVTVGLRTSTPCANAFAAASPATASNNNARAVRAMPAASNSILPDWRAPRTSYPLQQRVEETIMPFVRKDLARDLLCVRMRPGESHVSRIAVACEEAFDLFVVFLSKNRARGVQQFTIDGERLPKRVEDLALPLREARDVVGAPQPLDVRVPAHD